jgi:hypothetical protein
MQPRANPGRFASGLRPLTSPVLFLAWQDPASRRWFPIGRLARSPEGRFLCGYIRGFEAARAAGLEPLPSFPEVGRIHVSDHLFPLFRNRVMNAAREEYAAYLERLGLGAEGDPDEVALRVLARSRGLRTTDSFEVFPLPLEMEARGPRYQVDFFVHGLRHMPSPSQAAAAELGPGDPLHLMADVDNPVDSFAMALRTGAGHLIGYVPRYHGPDLHLLLGERRSIEAVVVRVNQPPAPPQQRVLCRLSAHWPFEHPPLSHRDYELIAEG